MLQQRAGFKSVATLRAAQEFPFETLADMESYAVKKYAQKPLFGELAVFVFAWVCV